MQQLPQGAEPPILLTMATTSPESFKKILDIHFAVMIMAAAFVSAWLPLADDRPAERTEMH
jgi:hypothetical protein